MLGNKLFIVCEYIPHSLLQVLEGTAESLASQPSAGTPAAQVAMHLKQLHNVETCFCCPQTFLSLDFHCRDRVNDILYLLADG